MGGRRMPERASRVERDGERLESAADDAPVPVSRRCARARFGSRDYRPILGEVLAGALVERSQGVAIGWDLYERTGSALALGWVGLAQFLPVILLFLPAGHLADRFDRRRVIVAGFAVWAAAVALLLAAAVPGAPAGWFYLAAAGIGTAQVASRPSRDALLPQLLERDLLGARCRGTRACTSSPRSPARRRRGR